ncbi:MAG: hypothetical protein ACRD3K_03250, partial [Edaphobacter sp.]
EVWQRGFSEVRVDDRESYLQHRHYIVQNPVQAGLAASSDKFPYCLTYLANQKAAGSKTWDYPKDSTALRTCLKTRKEAVISKRPVISTEATHSPIVGRAVEKSPHLSLSSQPLLPVRVIERSSPAFLSTYEHAFPIPNTSCRATSKIQNKITCPPYLLMAFRLLE